jgi:hypothetical protein
MRKVIIVLILFLGAAFVYLSFGELESILGTLRQGNFWFVLLGILIQLGWIFVRGLTYLSIFRLLGLQGTAYKLSLLAGQTLSTLAPVAVWEVAVSLDATTMDNLSSGC